MFRDLLLVVIEEDSWQILENKHISDFFLVLFLFFRCEFLSFNSSFSDCIAYICAITIVSNFKNVNYIAEYLLYFQTWLTKRCTNITDTFLSCFSVLVPVVLLFPLLPPCYPLLSSVVTCYHDILVWTRYASDVRSSDGLTFIRYIFIVRLWGVFCLQRMISHTVTR